MPVAEVRRRLLEMSMPLKPFLEYADKTVIMGAPTLYLDFINMFLFLLRFMGDQRR